MSEVSERVSAVQRWTPLRFAVVTVVITAIGAIASGRLDRFMVGYAAGIVFFAIYLTWVDRHYPDDEGKS